MRGLTAGVMRRCNLYSFIALCSALGALGEHPVTVLRGAIKQSLPVGTGLPALLHLPRLTACGSEHVWTTQRLMVQIKNHYDSANVKWLPDPLDYLAIKKGANCARGTCCFWVCAH